jgi:hypothetical protein
MEAQATEKRCDKCMKSPKQCSTCKSNAKLKALRKLRNETGADHPTLRKYRERNSENRREQVKSAKENGYTYNSSKETRRCKGPGQLVEGNTGSTCTKFRISSLSGDGRSFCTTCFDEAHGPDARRLLQVTPRVRKHTTHPQCVGLGSKSKVCPNRIDPEDGIRGALRKTGMKAKAFRAATQQAGALQSLVAAFEQAQQCLSCFQMKSPYWAAILRKFTQCIFKGNAGVRCQGTAYVEGLCDNHHAAKLPPAKTRCSDSECASGEPGVRKNRQVGRCQPCLDAMTRAAKRKAAETPAVGLPSKRQKR